MLAPVLLISHKRDDVYDRWVINRRVRQKCASLEGYWVLNIMYTEYDNSVKVVISTILLFIYIISLHVHNSVACQDFSKYTYTYRLQI